MYEPPLHRQDDLAALHALIRAHPLGLLISHGPSGLLANAIPFTLVDDGSQFGILRCHVARANPQWRDLQAASEALVVFQGAGSYITPSWYATIFLRVAGSILMGIGLAATTGLLRRIAP